MTTAATDRPDEDGAVRSPPARAWPRVVAAVLGMGVFVIALYELRHTLARYDFHQVRIDLRAIPAQRIAMSIGLTIAGYLALIAYHEVAQRFVRRWLAPRRTAFVGFVSYAISNALGFPLLLGGGVRYRLYNAWGLSSAEIALVVGFISVTFWLGVLAVGGVSLLLDPVQFPGLTAVPAWGMRLVGALLLLALAGYLATSLLRRRPFRLFGWEVQVPAPGVALTQMVIASADWIAAAGALWVLLPSHPPGLSFMMFLSAFVLGNVGGVVSHVPAGVGVFEWIIFGLLGPYMPGTALVGVVIAYRVIYYLLPLAVAATLLALNELARGRSGVARVVRAAGAWTPGVAPTLLAVTTFLGGSILLISGATPGEPGRLRLVSSFVPLGIIESSHFVSSLAGAALLVLSRGLARRVDAAYYLAVAVLFVGIIGSLLKGFDYEEAVALALILAALAPARRHFYRRASVSTELFSPAWLLMTFVVLGSSIGLGMFAYKHIEYSSDLWWRFALRGDAPRFLRATVGAMAILFIVAAQRLMRPAGVDRVTPDGDTMARVRDIVRAAPDTHASLALLRDKAFLFSEDRNAFVMYGVEGRSFVAMGDPVGPPRERRELAWRFRELADRHGASTVFYQVRMHNLPLYLDLGLSLLKIGEEARVPLAGFTLDGGARKGLRRVVKNVEKSGCAFGVIAEADVPALLPELRAVSDAWLAEKRTREKGFSLGFFDEAYLVAAPVAVVRRGTEIVAFANLWQGAGRDELSIDLMRYLKAAPDGVMEYLLIELMRWGSGQGFQHFNLGMAPLAGLENRQLAPIWNRIGALLFTHAEGFYNFQGLRAYKQKFDPVWEPRYLASPGGFRLPGILTNVSALVSRGLRGVIAK